jgi:hypothetical protein
MSIDLRCKSCGKRYRLKDSAAGRSFACKDCDTQLKVPQPPMEEAEDIWEDDSFEEDSWEEPVHEPRRRLG